MGNEKLEKLKLENGWTPLTKEKKEILKSFVGSVPHGIDLNAVREFEKYGFVSREELQTMTWEHESKIFTILNVPTMISDYGNHIEECRTAYVELNTSMIADDMRSGKLPNTFDYEERF